MNDLLNAYAGTTLGRTTECSPRLFAQTGELADTAQGGVDMLHSTQESRRPR